MRITKIYTKIGDKGSTLLATGEKILKNAPRIEAYGTLDELNANLGCLSDSLRGIEPCKDLLTPLTRIQNELFDLGAELSIPGWQKLGIKLNVLVEADINRLEVEIDAFNSTLAPLENFILPGGHLANSYSHLCRTVCRRAERNVVTLSETDELRPEVIKYLNRLSDWFFVVGRIISKRLGVNEVLWQQRK